MVNGEVVLLTVVDFAQRLVALREDRGLTQQTLADRVDIHVSNFRRNEAGTSAPTLDFLRNVALALNTCADSPVFDEDERGPADDLRLAFEAASTRLDDESKNLVRALIEGVMLRHEARHWADAS